MVEIFIDTKEKSHICIVEDNILTEYHIEEDKKLLGNIYRARVENILNGMDSAFVDIGEGRNAYLNLKDILTRKECKSGVDYKIGDLIKSGDEILVQVVKESYKEKGAKVTTHLSFPGKFIVLTPYNLGINVSKKIRNKKEIKRLKGIGNGLTNEIGIIFRTASYGIDEESIVKEYRELINIFEDVKAQRNFLPTPKLIHKDRGLIYKIIRDRINDEVSILVNSKDLYKELIETGELEDYSLKDRIKLQEDFRLEYNLIIQKGLQNALNRRVNLKSGGYIVIDELEALTAIDVNTGKYIGGKSYEDTVLKTNLEACEEIAYQVKLRNLSGIIIIDFIDMDEEENVANILNMLNEAFENDKNKVNIIGMTKLGLVEITRQRTRPSLQSEIKNKCPSCGRK